MAKKQKHSVLQARGTTSTHDVHDDFPEISIKAEIPLEIREHDQILLLHVRMNVQL